MRGKTPRSRLRRLVSLGLLLLWTSAVAGSGCVGVVPYDPGRARIECIGGWPSDAFERVQDVVLRSYPWLEVSDREKFAWQSGWCAKNHVDTAAQSRLTLWREGDEICAVIEVRYLQGSLISVPSWSQPRGNRFWERDLLDAVKAALEAS